MSETAAPKVYVRPNPRDLREIPLDTDSALQAIAALTPLQRGVWFALRTHLWLYGRLPATPKELAAIGGVTPRTLEKMSPALAPLFDHDSTGRWRDLDLEEERDKRLDLEPGRGAIADAFSPRAVDPDLSEKRRRAGRAGSERRWGDRRQRLTLVAGGRAEDLAPDGGGNDNLAAASAMPPVMANAIANEMANNAAVDGSSSIDLLSDAMPGASGPPGPSDRLLDSQSLEEVEESDGRTDERGAGGSAGKTAGKPGIASGEAGGKTAKPIDGKVADVSTPAPTSAIAKMPDPMAHASPSAMAQAAPASLPYTVGEALEGRPVPALPADATIIEALRKAGGTKIPSDLLTAEAIAPVRALLEIGVDVDGDVVPIVETTVRNLTTPLRSWKASFFRNAVLARRDERLKQPTPALAMTRVYRDDPALVGVLDAALAHLGRSRKVFFRHDPRGAYAEFDRAAWDAALTAARSEQVASGVAK